MMHRPLSVALEELKAVDSSRFVRGRLWDWNKDMPNGDVLWWLALLNLQDTIAEQPVVNPDTAKIRELLYTMFDVQNARFPIITGDNRTYELPVLEWITYAWDVMKISLDQIIYMVKAMGY